jgi:hypothetical protein
MIVYFAGGFETLGKVEKELELANLCLNSFGSYNRLSSFFFKKETDNVIEVVKLLKEDNDGKGSRGSWDFIKVGKLYQYKEDSIIFVVEILEDNSTEDYYEFLVLPIAGTIPAREQFTIGFNKSMTGAYNGQAQFYETPEYMFFPKPKTYPFIFDAEKLEGSKFVWPKEEE